MYVTLKRDILSSVYQIWVCKAQPSFKSTILKYFWNTENKLSSPKLNNAKRIQVMPFFTIRFWKSTFGNFTESLLPSCSLIGWKASILTLTLKCKSDNVKYFNQLYSYSTCKITWSFCYLINLNSINYGFYGAMGI